MKVQARRARRGRWAPKPEFKT